MAGPEVARNIGNRGGVGGEAAGEAESSYLRCLEARPLLRSHKVQNIFLNAAEDEWNLPKFTRSEFQPFVPHVEED